MKKAALLLTGVFLFTCSCHAQWVIQPGVGIAVPLTGYGSIVDPGLYFHMDFNKQLTDERFRLGIMLGWARMHSDDNGSDLFDNARIDQVPFVFTIDYELSEKAYKPYLGLGLGVSYYSLTFDQSATTTSTEDNISFSMLPRVGLRYEVNKRLFPFIEVNAPLVMDGSPKGSDFSDKSTGYIGIGAGLAYRFIK